MIHPKTISKIKMILGKADAKFGLQIDIFETMQ